MKLNDHLDPDEQVTEVGDFEPYKGFGQSIPQEPQFPPTPNPHNHDFHLMEESNSGLNEETVLPVRSRQQNPRESFSALDEETYIEPLQSTGPIGYLFTKEPLVNFGNYHPIYNRSTIGRGGRNMVEIEDRRVSENHGCVQIEKDPDNKKKSIFVLYDFGSKSGTLLNGKAVRGCETLQENDLIQICDYVFVFKSLT